MGILELMRERRIYFIFLPNYCWLMILTFIGDRRIGLIVVDEAHTVTTWGKEFRVDYWFLGRHLDNLKKNLGYAFPVLH